MSEFDLETIFETLSQASSAKPWMTARGLARKTGGDARLIEKRLMEHVQRADNPRVRYSSLPSRRTLEVLWGDLENVGRRPLENITKDDVADEMLAGFGDLSEVDVFLSHSHRDYDAVMDLARYLLQRKVVPWLAETHIGHGEHIHDEIIGALKASQHFLLFLSPNALDSRWTGKEYSNARSQGKTLFVVADARHKMVRDWLQIREKGKPWPSAFLDQFQSGARHFMSELLDDDAHLVQVYSWPDAQASGQLAEAILSS